MAEAVGADPLADTGSGAQPLEHDPDVGLSHPVTFERAEDRMAAAQT
jgi:hypothetical protein